jgi:hypothetical protein
MLEACPVGSIVVPMQPYISAILGRHDVAARTADEIGLPSLSRANRPFDAWAMNESSARCANHETAGRYNALGRSHRHLLRPGKRFAIHAVLNYGCTPLVNMLMYIGLPLPLLACI